MSTFKSRLGKCYELAGRYVMDNPHALLVYGTINGKAWGLEDMPNGHAWVVEDDKWVLDLVLDIKLPVVVYGRLFAAQAERAYNHEEMCKLCLQTEHWGPWHIQKGQDNGETGTSILPRENRGRACGAGQ